MRPLSYSLLLFRMYTSASRKGFSTLPSTAARRPKARPRERRAVCLFYLRSSSWISRRSCCSPVVIVWCPDVGTVFPGTQMIATKMRW